MTSYLSYVARAMIAAGFCIATVAAAEAAFVVISPDVQDDGLAPVAGAQPACGGGSNASLPLAWSGAPDGTKSYAIVLTDVDNWKSAGVAAHWVAYGIPASVSSVPEGFGSPTSPEYVSGLNFTNIPGYRGYCPPKTDEPHHYVYTVLATDLAPQALPPALTREGLTEALKGHTLAGSSIVVRYGQSR